MASADIMCVDSKAIREKFTGMIRWCTGAFPMILFCLVLVPSFICFQLMSCTTFALVACSILCLDSCSCSSWGLREPMRGKFLINFLCFTCRQQDVRATEIDKVDMYQSYRPGDIVKAMVVSLIDENDAVQIISVFFSCYQPWLGLLALRLSTSTFLSCRNFLNL